MEAVDVLIIGQGLAGSWLSWWLEKKGLSYRIIDNADPTSASRRAAGLINPVTGRRLVKTWMIDELMPFAYQAHREMGQFLGTELISETSVIDFFPTVQMLQAFQTRLQEDPAYLKSGENAMQYQPWFNYDLGWGAISPCYLVHTERLLSGWRKELLKKGQLQAETFHFGKLVGTTTGFQYDDLQTRFVIFCDGKAGAGIKYFEKLPFALNKGEGLLVEINDLPANKVFKKGMNLIPWKENIFWVGSSYQWAFDHDQPSEQFRTDTERWLKHFVRMPFKILDHFAAIRPATLERRPFAGFHPQYPGIGILNGLGTKGCSLAPYFAAQLATEISGLSALDPLADIKRFQRILMKR